MTATTSGAHGPGPDPDPDRRERLVDQLPPGWRPLLAQPGLSSLLGDPLVDDALRELRRLVPSSLAVHSLRTFLLADAYARRGGIGYDRPGLLAAAAFHDTGLTAARREARGTFPHRSAVLFERFLAEHAVAPGRRGALVRAVREHMRLLPVRGACPEARLLHFGAWLDVTRRGSGRVPGERHRLHELAPTPWFAASFTVRVATCRLGPAAPLH